LEKIIGAPRQGPRAARWRAFADAAVDGAVHFGHQGFHPVAVGRSGIDWRGGHWKHNQWPAQLNRLVMLGSLAIGYRETGDSRYAEAARDYLEDWMNAHPETEDWDLADHDNVLNLAIRLQAWFGELPSFLDAACFDDAFLERLQRHGAMQLERLETRTRPALMNWGIFQAESLLHNGLRLAGMEGAERWRDTGVRVLNDAWHRQVLPDGAHVERTPTYHNRMKIAFTDLWRLGRAHPSLGVAVGAEKLARMHDYAVAVLTPYGHTNAMHDAKGKWALDPEDGPDPSGRFAEREAFLKEAGRARDLPAPKAFYPHAGQALLRSGWDRKATYVTFDATRWGSGHNHPSRNAVQLYHRGRALVVDPGSFSYEESDPWSPYGRSTRSHSTMTVNGWNQGESNPETRYTSAPGYQLVDSEFDGGYWPNRRDFFWREGHGRGLYARHHRAMLWVEDRFVVVLDLVRRDAMDGAVALECNWQLGPGMLELDSNRRVAVTRHPDANVKMLFPLLPDAMGLEMREGWTDPIHGWVPGDERYEPAPLLRVAADDYAEGYANLAAVLVPFEGPQAPEVAAEGGFTERNDAVVRLRWDDGTRDEMHWAAALSMGLGKVEDLETDAALVHRCFREDGSLHQGLAAYATYVKPHAPRGRVEPETFRIDAER
jgi:hypothetical protein